MYISLRATFHGIRDDATERTPPAVDTTPVTVSMCTGTQTVHTAGTDVRSVAKAVALAHSVTPAHVGIFHAEVTHPSHPPLHFSKRRPA